MTEPMAQGKTHDVPKRLVWEAWLKVKENQGAAGADGVTIERFEAKLKGNLYQLWNQHHGFKKVVVADLGFCCERV